MVLCRIVAGLGTPTAIPKPRLANSPSDVGLCAAVSSAPCRFAGLWPLFSVCTAARGPRPASSNRINWHRCGRSMTLRLRIQLQAAEEHVGDFAVELWTDNRRLVDTRPLRKNGDFLFDGIPIGSPA